MVSSVLHQRNNNNDITGNNLKKASLVRTVSNWSYLNLCGVEWDAQPACFITNYVLAAQCFICGIYILYNTSVDSYILSPGSNLESSVNLGWYAAYFLALGVTAAMGGLLHHLAYKALNAFMQRADISIAGFKANVERVRILGVNITRRTTDRIINTAWRIVLGMSSVSHFVLFSLSAQKYFTETVALWIMVSAATLYLVFIIWSTIHMDTLFMLIGFLPALLFLGFTSIVQVETHGIIALLLKLSSGIVQGIGVCPSKKHFNHNALAHVLLSISAVFMMYNYSLH